MSSYWKKKLEELEQSNSPSKSTKKETTKSATKSDYWVSKLTELEKAEDIAPVAKPKVETTTTKIVGVKSEKEEKGSFWDWLGNSAMSGLASFNKGLTGTADLLLGKPLQALGWENNPISEAAEYYSDEYDIYKNKATTLAKQLGGDKNIAGMGNGYQIAGELLEGTVAAAPMAIEALMSGGTSMVDDLATAFTYRSGNLLAKAGLTAEKMTKNPAFWTSFAQTYSNDYEEAVKSGVDENVALYTSMLSSLINAGIEIGIDGASGIQGLPKKALDGDKSALMEWVISSIEEGGEEVLQGVVSRGINDLSNGADGYIEWDEDTKIRQNEVKVFDLEQMLKEGLMGTAVGGILGGGQIGVQSSVNAVQQAQANKLTETEQAVVDKVVENRIAEEEAEGKTLTAREKKAIEKQVRDELDKGYISIDDIEATLGGDTYKAYQDTIANEDALHSEFDILNKMKQGEMTGEQIDRRAELKQQLADLKTNSQRDQLRQQLSDEVFGIAKDSRLAESYNERTRRGQTFDADVSKYDAKQQAVIQKAVDSGILNNTNRTHEFVDMIAKISADKGVSFDFTNNERLKESGYAVDGATINGFVTKDGITLNIDSSKATRSVAGHEITHILEGTELYTELQNAVFEYAKTKGEYDSRLSALTKLYENVEGADVNAELTADLVGDYLFDDADFINNLSTKHRNVFQKIYDEIKYLCKVATAGSKEARELEKVKKAFEDAYRADSKASGDTKYSLGYHAGDLGKAELLHQQGYSRGTGHFGTGTYFVGDEAKISGHTYGARPHHAVEFDNYNLYKVRNDDDGYALHDQLKVIDGGISQEYYDRAVADEFSLYPYVNAYELAESKYKTPDNSWDDAMISAYQEIADMRGIEYQSAEEWGKENDYPVSYEWFAEDYREYLEQTVKEAAEEAQSDYAEFRDAYFKLWLRFGKDSTNKALQSVIAHQQKINPDGQRDYLREQAAKADSFATVFMKSLGYEGIDTRGTALDNVEYGSVIYDLKGEDLAKKNAIGTAKYSLTDNTGKELSKGQQDYFKDSKMRDDDGNLMVMYHGSQDAGFHIFDGKYSDDDVSFFFVDRNDVAASYSGTTETYEARTMHTAKDVNDFIAEIGAEGYEVVENDGKFILLYEGDRAASSDTAKGIYEEFCWYEGVGEGDANYKVYLNLTNPLIVDGKGRPWNKIDAEFSQEVYDKYNSLTAEEKAALTDLAEWEDFRLFNSEIQEAEGNELASAYAKMGEDVNIYDLFSVAADNFSEESMRENARRYLKTRDFAQRAHEQGYDGVIFKNIVDNGGYSNGSEGASTVAIAFDSKQIKSTANVNPTTDADIRYSLTEYTAEEKKAHNDAVLDYFGKTYSWNETGYLLLDGTRLDLSGKHEGASGGYRTVDHRDIVNALGDDYGDGSYSGSLVQFMSEGNIRIIPEMGGINLSVKPTEAQEKALAAYVQMHRGEVVLDIDDTNGYTVASVEYPAGTRSSKVLGDIRAYFEDGTKPEYSLSRKGATHRYARGDAPMSDLRYDAPVQETVPVEDAPIADNAIPDNFAPATEEDVAAMAEESFAALEDADAPPEMEAPYYGESEPETAADPLADRDWVSVGDRKVKAFMYENPEVKPFFQAEANAMLGDLYNTIKGERHYNDQVYYDTNGEKGWYGTKRFTADDIAYLLDGGISYAQLEKGLNAIIEDNGAENNAVSKRIELAISDRLRNGYTDFMTGEQIPPNQEYIEWLNEQQAEAEYAESAAAITDADAPMIDAPISEEIAPVAESQTVEDVMPIADAPIAEQYEAIRPKPEKQPRMVRADSENATPKAKQRKWVGTSTESEVVNREVLPDDLDQNAIHYQPIPNKVTLGKANTRLDGMGYDAALNYFNAQFAGKKVSLEDIALGERLIQEAIKKGDTKTAGELIQNVAILGTELGQKVQALSIIKRLTPEGQLKMLQKVVERGKAKGDKAYDGVQLPQVSIDEILRSYNPDGSYDQDKLNKAIENAKQKLADQMSVSAMDKINAWRYLSMLGNPKTHIRNLVSNVAMKGTVAVKNAIARTVEDIAPIENRTKTWKPATDYVKSFAEKTTTEMQDVLQDGGKYSEDASIKAKRKIFKSKMFGWLNVPADANSNLLSKEDWWFSKPAFKNAFAECLTANGIRTEQDVLENPETVEMARQYATEQAQIATFRQYSWLANKINEIEQKNAATQIAVGAVLPFKKTPINIAKAGLNYSPLGFAKTLAYDIPQVKKGNMEASELVDHLAQNLTGTGLALLGYMLAQAGVLSGGGGDDKEAKYDYQLGKQSYALNIGDKSYSLSWLSPVAMPMFVGTNAYETLVEKEEWNGDVVVQTLAETLDPLSEMSFLSGLDSVLSSYESGMGKFLGVGEAMAQNYATQFAPTLMSQVATVLDDTKRSTKASKDSGWRFGEETLNKIKYKIPLLRNTLEPSTDIWGNDIKQTENKVARAVETFIAPYAVRENTATAIDEELKGLYREVGESSILPSIPDNYVNFKDEKYDMSADDFTAYKKTYGQTAYDMLGELFDTDTYQNADADLRADLIKDVYDYARDEAKLEYLKKQGVDYTNTTEEGVPVYKENAIKGAIYYDVTPDEYTFMRDNPKKYEFFNANGISYETYKAADEDGKRAYTWAYENPAKYTMSKAISDDFLTYYKYKSDLYDIKADKDEYGDTITGTGKEKKLDYINSLDIDYGQKIILFRSLYSSKEDKANYNADIVDYLNSRDDISYDEMVTILEELDMTVDSNGNIYW